MLNKLDDNLEEGLLILALLIGAFFFAVGFLVGAIVQPAVIFV